MLQMQIDLPFSPGDVYEALTRSDAVASWFAEHAHIAPAEARYDFWGRFTPETPAREAGHHPLLTHTPAERLAYQWSFHEQPTTVYYRLLAHDGGTRFALTHDISQDALRAGVLAGEDFWFLSLENLNRFLHDRPAVRCDFGQPMTGDVRHAVEIDAPADAVWPLLIEPAQVNKWIANNATIEPAVGGTFDLGWGEGVAASKILDLAPKQRLSYAWAEHEGQATVVTWTLEESGGKTRLSIVHSGFADDEPTGGLYGGWLNFIVRVQNIAELGDDWAPPILRVPPEIAAWYAKPIADGQTDLLPMEEIAVR
jgi:uncharacterized protein YndB with AHSA1/START domain